MTNAQLRRRVAIALAPIYACLVGVVVFLPLPGPHTPPLRQSIQLVPFQWVDDVRRELHDSGFSLAHALTMPAFEGAAFNVLLFVPLGIFARMLFKRGLVGTALLGFACSLLIELTQLTANWGTAGRQYRIFDVDDLINNTLGAMLGWIVGALVLALLSAKALSYTAVATAKARPAHPGVPVRPPYARPPVDRLAGPPRQPSRWQP